MNSLPSAWDIDGLRAEIAARSHEDFMRMCWTQAHPFVVGKHTRFICGEIDRAIERYRDHNESTFLVIMVPFRHGKSDLVSRYLPPRWFALFPDTEIILTTYGQELANDMSRDARRIIESEEYGRMFPEIKVSQDSSAVNRWGVAGRSGRMAAVGFGGPMTGRGMALGIVDDYFKSREQAESITIRERVWDSFTNDFLTRRAPKSIIIVMASPWHKDDVIGRIQKRMQSDPEFPRFRIVRMPAFDDEYEEGVLFPERYPRAWYLGQRASLGPYASAALLQCEPVSREGRLLKTENVVIHDSIEEFPQGLEWVRAWDLASTEEDMIKSDPDWTVGSKLAVDWIPGVYEGLDIPRLWIADVVRGRWEAPERDRRIVQVAMMDGDEVRIATESVAGYKDTYTRLRDMLRGVRVVLPVVPSRDKLVRAAPLEPIFEAGNVHILRGAWNSDFLAELDDHPGGNHDDQIDSISTGWEIASKSGPAVRVA